MEAVRSRECAERAACWGEIRADKQWNTAGRFVSSLCDGDGDVPRFFDALLALHKRLKVGEALEHAGVSNLTFSHSSHFSIHSFSPSSSDPADTQIAPSSDVTYSLSDIDAALSPFGPATPICAANTLTHIYWPLNARGNLAGFVSDPSPKPALKSNCPAQGIIYPPAAVIQATPTTWDPIYKPTMRPITLSHDESRRVKYDDEKEEEAGEGKMRQKKKLGFFKRQDQRRAGDEHGHEQYARDEL